MALVTIVCDLHFSHSRSVPLQNLIWLAAEEERGKTRVCVYTLESDDYIGWTHIRFTGQDMWHNST